MNSEPAPSQTPAQKPVSHFDPNSINRPDTTTYLWLGLLIFIGLILAFEGWRITSQAITPSGYAHTQAMVSNSNCTSESLTFSAKNGHSYTVTFNPPTLGRSSGACPADNVGAQIGIAYSPSSPTNFTVPSSDRTLLGISTIAAGLAFSVIVFLVFEFGRRRPTASPAPPNSGS